MLNIVLFHSFLHLSSIPLYSIFLIYSFVNGHLGHFHVLAIVTNAAINKGGYIFGLVLSGYTPRSGIAGSWLLLLLSNFSCVQLYVNPWTIAHQAPVSMGILVTTMGSSLPGSSVHGISQARILELVAMPSSRGSSQPRDQTQVSHIAGGFFTVWTTREAQEYQSG